MGVRAGFLIVGSVLFFSPHVQCNFDSFAGVLMAHQLLFSLFVFWMGCFLRSYKNSMEGMMLMELERRAEQPEPEPEPEPV